jgi:flagellum-specific peptidoglycan hydrolase FlgJ
VDPTSLYLALRIAWRAQVHTEPSRSSLLTLMAQSDFETGSWRECRNWNLAGIKHVEGDGHDYAVYGTQEYLHGKWVHVDAAFRAYPNLNAAADDYMSLLRGRFGYAWPAVEAGDVTDFAHRLRARGYYTAPEDMYAAGLRARYAALDTQPDINATAAVRTELLNETIDDEEPDPPEAA